MLVRCRCVHAAQDSLHGASVRVANELKRKDSGPLQARCSVCGAIHEVRGAADDSSAKKGKKKEASAEKPAAPALTK